MYTLLGIGIGLFSLAILFASFFMGAFLMAVSHDSPSKDPKTKAFQKQASIISIGLAIVGISFGVYIMKWALYFFYM